MSEQKAEYSASKTTIENSGLVTDTANANAGTQRGRGLLEKSIRKLGAGRSILADKNGNVIAGNKTLEVAADLELPVRIIETDGTELVVVKRTDLDLHSKSDKRGRQLAYADNKVAELDLSWDGEMIANDFVPLELGEWGFASQEPFNPMDEWQGMPEFENEPKAAKSLCVHFRTIADYESFCALIEQDLSEKTNSTWFPKAERRDMKSLVFENEQP